MEIIILGQMDNSEDHTHESANRVYSTTGICPVINTCGGGGLQPKIINFPPSEWIDCEKSNNRHY